MNELEQKYGVRKCKCGEQLIPRKKWFKNLIFYKCPKSNLFNRKNHSISRAFFVNMETISMKLK